VAADRGLKLKVPLKISTVFLSFPTDRLENLIVKIKLPGCLSYSGNLALVCELTEADTADTVLTKISMRSATDLASVVCASRELRLSLLLEYH